MKPTGPRSLKARALQWLAQREHSRSELRRKLLPHAKAEWVAAAATGSDNSTHESSVDALLDWLEAQRYLSQERFAESRVHARSARYGNLRIRRELAQHGVALNDVTQQSLQASEFERARAVWSRKFPLAVADTAERAKQARFLTGRGFSPEVVRRVLREVGRTAAAEVEADS